MDKSDTTICEGYYKKVIHQNPDGSEVSVMNAGGFFSSVDDKSFIGRNVKIGLNVNIINSHIGDNTTIEDNTSILDSIVGDNVSISYSNYINHAIIENWVKIGMAIKMTDCIIKEAAIIHSYVMIHSGAEIGCGVEISRDRLVPADSIIENNDQANELEKNPPYKLTPPVVKTSQHRHGHCSNY